MADKVERTSSVEEILRRKGEMQSVIKAIAAVTGSIGGQIDPMLLVGPSAVLAQWEVALQIALRNRKDGIVVEESDYPQHGGKVLA